MLLGALFLGSRVVGCWRWAVSGMQCGCWDVWSSGVHTTLMLDRAMVLSLWECMHVLTNLTIFQQLLELHDLSVQNLLILVLKEKENSN